MTRHSLPIDWKLNLARLAGVLTLVLGAIVLVGWYLHEPALIQVNPAFVPMQYNTALGFAMGGLALVGLAWAWPRVAVITGFIVLLTGVLTLIEYSFGIDLHIDQLFMEHYIDLKTSNPGRMAPNTALCFSLTGLTVLLTGFFHDRTGITAWTATLGALIISLGVTALAGYMIGVEGAYGWGHMTRMAIHTAAGFIILGSGFVALAWARDRLLLPGAALPRWAPQVIGITGLTITFAMWQALSAQEQRMVSGMGAGAANFSDEGLLVFGILLTLALVYRARTAARGCRVGRRTSRVYAPYVVIALGALLAASLYSLLRASFESSVKQRFDASALNHVEAVEHGIEAYLETLYHIRSGFDASSHVDRDEFHMLVRRSLERNPGIKALEWVPRVQAGERDAMEAAAREEVSLDFVFTEQPAGQKTTIAPQSDVYFPIYYVEPKESFLSILGFDLGTRPDYLATLMKAARENTPAVSSRLQLSQSEKGVYSVFVALPIYRRHVPLDSAEAREAALRGFAVMVVEIGPMTEAIFEKSISPAGLTFTYADAEAGDEAFMYRHVSRDLDIGPDNNETDYLDGGLTTTTTLAFADQKWHVTAHAANREVYPEWGARSLWLPLGILLLSLGLAWFLHRSSLRERERARLLAFQTALLNAIPNPIFVKDVRAAFTDCNKAYEKAFGISWNDIVGKTAMELDYIAEDHRRAVHDEDVLLISKGGYSQKETERVYADGATHNVMYWRTTFELADGEPGGMIGGLFDISELKSLQVDLEKARDIADIANQAKSSFLANMSHELRTPMNAILGYSEMLMEEAEDVGQKEFVPDLKKINQAGTHLLALINDVLDLSKIESGKMETFAEEIGLDSLIDEVSATAQPLMSKNGNKLSIERGQQLGNAHQDLTKIRQTLFNLLSNAAKFTRDGTVTLHVDRTEQAGVDWLTFAVSDSGIGIAEDKLDHVFEEFTQADGSTTRDYGGTGLGLAISRRFCKLLGGDLVVQSELGKGATFTIRVPAILPGSEPQHPPVETPPAKTETELKSLREAGPGSTILVIDDDPEACDIIERYLTKDGYAVVTAGSGEQGLSLAHEIQPAVITLDVMMPSMDGWSVLCALKADPVLRKIPVIMLTMIDDRTRGYSLGAVDYLTKPVDREQLHKALSRYYCTEDICSVLLVEDDPETREVMARTLEKAGWSVSEAGNGQEALDIMDSLRPRLILLDLMMPVMDGFGFLAAMRAKPEWQHIPVIVVTAKDLTEEDRTRLAGSVEQVLEKNAYTREQLLERVRDAVTECNINQSDRKDTGKER